MDRESLVQKFETLRVWQSGDERAPHKPLLVLYAIGKLLRGEGRLIPFAEVDKNLGNLLSEFAPERTVQRTEYPFWRLQNDEIWEVIGPDEILPEPQEDASKSDLINYNVRGGFTEEVFNQFQTDTDLAFEITRKMLNKYFYAELHAKILYWVWIDCKGPRLN